MPTRPSDPSSPLPGLPPRGLRAAERDRPVSDPAVELGRFVVLERLGEGGMGVVYAAYDPTLDRRVAVKVLHGAETHGDPSARRRLEREAKAMAKLSHPNVVTVHEVGTHEGHVFLAMQHVGGGTLRQWCEALPPGPAARFETALTLLRQAAEGLAAAHDVGLVHRDVKPHNILLETDPRAAGVGLRARVGDFGLARYHGTATPPATGSDATTVRADDAGTTQPTSSRVAGTPSYMAPEQFEGHADARSDQFSLCATFFEVFSGARPFPNSSWDAPTQVFGGGPEEWPEGQSTPRWVRAVLARGMARAPADRFADLAELLRTIDRRQSAPARRTWLVVAGLGVAGAGAVLATRPTPPPPAVDPCDDGRSSLEPALGARRRSAIRSAFQSTGEPFWRVTWERLDARLETYADQWSAQYVEAC
ncbi:MAG: serine/threonine-protein kinase, partial [Myxococcota bacterium]